MCNCLDLGFCLKGVVCLTELHSSCSQNKKEKINLLQNVSGFFNPGGPICRPRMSPFIITFVTLSCPLNP